MLIAQSVVLSALALSVSGAPLRTPDWHSQTTKAAPSGRWAPQMTYDAGHNESVLFGGISASKLGPQSNADTWVWQGEAWTQLFPAASPPARESGKLVYDAARNNCVLFGGNNFIDDGIEFTFGDTWVWDGVNWTQRFPEISPGQRYGFAMAYDQVHGVVVLFGGTDGVNFLNDTWTWNGTNWTQQFPASKPSPRFQPSLTYDGANRQTVLLGGAGPGGILSDTWVWDGSDWTEKVSPVMPSPRYGALLEYDASETQVILFGGEDSSGTLADTWSWNGQLWSPASPRIVPKGRFYPGEAYDSSTGQIVMFGGGFGTAHGNIYLDDSWLWY